MIAPWNSQWNKFRSVEKFFHEMVASDLFANYVEQDFKVVCLDRIPFNLAELVKLNYAFAWKLGMERRLQNKLYCNLQVMIMTRKDSMNEKMLKAEDVFLFYVRPTLNIRIHNFLEDGTPDTGNSLVITELRDIHGVQELAQGFKFKEHQVVMTMPI